MKKHRWIRTMAVVAALMLTLAMVGCSGATSSAAPANTPAASSGSAPAAAGGEFKVGWINATLSNAFYKVLVDTAQAEAQALGWNFTYVDSQMDSTKELAAFEDMITNKVDLIYVDCVDPVAVVAGIRKANEANIPVIVVDNPVDNAEAEGVQVVTTIMSDNVGLGLATGAWAAQQIDKDTPIKALELSGQAGNQGNYKRRTGAWAGLMAERINQKEGTSLAPEDMLERAYELEEELISKGRFYDERSDFELMMQTFGGFTEEGGLQCMEDMLTAHPDANLMFCESDPMAVGAMQAINARDLGDQILVSCVADGSKACLELIQAGEIDSCGENNPAKVAKLSIEQGKLLQEGKDPASFEKINYTPPVIIDKSNVEGFLAEAGEF